MVWLSWYEAMISKSAASPKTPRLSLRLVPCSRDCRDCCSPRSRNAGSSAATRSCWASQNSNSTAVMMIRRSVSQCHGKLLYSWCFLGLVRGSAAATERLLRNTWDQRRPSDVCFSFTAVAAGFWMSEWKLDPGAILAIWFSRRAVDVECLQLQRVIRLFIPHY